MCAWPCAPTAASRRRQPDSLTSRRSWLHLSPLSGAWSPTITPSSASTSTRSLARLWAPSMRLPRQPHLALASPLLGRLKWPSHRGRRRHPFSGRRKKQKEKHTNPLTYLYYTTGTTGIGGCDPVFGRAGTRVELTRRLACECPFSIYVIYTSPIASCDSGVYIRPTSLTTKQEMKNGKQEQETKT